MYRKKYVFIITFILCFLLFPVNYYANEIDYSEDFEPSSLETSSNISSLPELNSRAAIVIEKSTGAILFGKNENVVRKMASTTKIMTALVVLENISDLSEIVTISKKAANIGGSRLGLSSDSKISVEDLLYGLLLCSGNDAAIALAEFVGGNVESFANLMNQKAIALNLENTHFITPHGLDNDEHYTTAYELALLTKYALENETFSKIVGTKNHTVYINNSPKNISNTNELLGYLNGVYGVKTGFTNGANRCLVSSCKRGDLDIICVVLGADTKKFRTQDSIKLIEYAFSNFEMVDLNSIVRENFSKWQSEASAHFSVRKGISNNIETELETIPYSKYPVNKSNIKDIEIEINSAYSFEAPLLENTTIGTINCFINNKNIFSVNIYSSQPILKKNSFLYFRTMLKDYCFYLENIFKS